MDATHLYIWHKCHLLHPDLLTTDFRRRSPKNVKGHHLLEPQREDKRLPRPQIDKHLFSPIKHLYIAACSRTLLQLIVLLRHELFICP